MRFRDLGSVQYYFQHNFSICADWEIFPATVSVCLTVRSTNLTSDVNSNAMLLDLHSRGRGKVGVLILDLNILFNSIHHSSLNNNLKFVNCFISFDAICDIHLNTYKFYQ